MKWVLFTLSVLVFATATAADDKKPTGPMAVTLTIVAKTDKYKFNAGDKTPAEYKKELEDIAKQQDKGKAARPPKPPAVDLVLVFTNTSKEDVTLYLGGDSNVYTFELTGGTGVVNLKAEAAFTADFKLPKAVTIAPGKTHEIPVKQLSDGFRGASRHLYWTGPGEYKLTAKYGLSDQNGGKGAELKSEPVKLTVTEK